MKKVSLSGHQNSPLYLWQIGTDQNPISGGLNLTDLEYMLADNQSPKMENMWYHNRVLGKRPGQRYEGPILPDGVHTLYRFGSAIYGANDSSVFCLKQDGSGQLVLSQMAAGLTGKGFAHFYEFSGKLFLMNGANHLMLENQAFVPVVPYTPTLVINRPPNGLGGDLVENYNRLGGAFCNKFSADGTSTIYALTDQNLDDKPVTLFYRYCLKKFSAYCG